MEKDIFEERFLRIKEVMLLVPFARPTIWQKVKQGRFPTPIKLSERVTVWRLSDIREFMKKCEEASIQVRNING